MEKRVLGMRFSRIWRGASSRPHSPLHPFAVKLNNGRTVSGLLRGYDPFMNLVLDESVEEVSPTEKHSMGMVVRCAHRPLCCSAD